MNHSTPAGSSLTQALHFALSGWRFSIVFLFPAAILLRALHFAPVLIFSAAALALVPLASLLGDATEQLAAHVGTAAGGLLNATLGNTTELVIGVVGLWGGHLEVVKASIAGSIVGELLLVFGLSAFVGGLGREKLRFSTAAVGANISMLFLAVVALVMPALFQLSASRQLSPLNSPPPPGLSVDRLSLWTAVVLLIVYAASLVFMFRTHRNLFRGAGFAPPVLGRSTALGILIASAGLTVVASQILISQVEPVTRALGWSELFVGLIIVAMVGNAAEHSAAVMLARRDQMDLALNIAIGSSAQIALFVAPLLVLISQARPPAMSLVFHPLETAAVIISVGVVTAASIDGETNWFEGLQLLAVYAILAVVFYFLP
ncbi:MAG TPA: calcium/proton exchanger [Terriglobia bacterium]|nr:calcium/proton exchanger [Terriglobia bacterium]